MAKIRVLTMETTQNPYLVLVLLMAAAVAFRADAAGGGVGLGQVFLAPETGQGQERHLRVRPRIQRRCVDSFPFGILPLRHHFSRVRRGDDFSAAVRGFVHRPAGRRVRGDDYFSGVAGGRPGLGLAERIFDLELSRKVLP